MTDGIYLNDIPLDIFLDYLSSSDISSKENTPVSETMTFEKYNNDHFIETVWKVLDNYYLLNDPTTTSSSSSFLTIFSKSQLIDAIDTHKNILDSLKELYVSTISIPNDINIPVYRLSIPKERVNSDNSNYSQVYLTRNNQFSLSSSPIDILAPSIATELWMKLSEEAPSTNDISDTTKYYLKKESLASTKPDAINENDSGFNICPGIHIFLGTDNKLYLSMSITKNTFPMTNSNGDNIYQDSDGLLTTKASYKNNFYTHQKAIRQTYAGLRDKSSWVYRSDISPRQVVILKERGKEYFSYYDKITKTVSYSRGIAPENAIINSKILPKSIIGTSESTEIRKVHKYLDINSIPEYNVYMNTPKIKLEAGTNIDNNYLQSYKFLLATGTTEMFSTPRLAKLNIYNRYAEIPKYGSVQLGYDMSLTVVGISLDDKLVNDWAIKRKIYNPGENNSFITIPIPASAVNESNHKLSFKICNPNGSIKEINITGTIDFVNSIDYYFNVPNLGNIPIIRSDRIFDPTDDMINQLNNVSFDELEYVIKFPINIKMEYYTTLLCIITNYQKPHGNKNAKIMKSPINNNKTKSTYNIKTLSRIEQIIPSRHGVVIGLSNDKPWINNILQSADIPNIDFSNITPIKNDDLTWQMVHSPEMPNILIQKTDKSTGAKIIDDIFEKRYLYVYDSIDLNSFVNLDTPTEILRNNIPSGYSVSDGENTTTENLEYYTDPYHLDGEVIIKTTYYTISEIDTKCDKNTKTMYILNDDIIAEMQKKNLYITDLWFKLLA